MGEKSFIIVENLSKSFGEDDILKDISVSFEAGKIYGVVGNNGSGKTVFFKCISGFVKPSHGKVYIDGKQIGHDIDFPNSMGILIEAPGFLNNISGFKNLKLLAQLRNQISDKQIKLTIEKVGLDPALKKPVGKYSLGMRQRLGIAQALMENPDCYILDEPFNGLDKHGVREIKQIILELRKEGKTIILASHNAVDIEELCDFVLEMDNGKLTQV